MSAESSPHALSKVWSEFWAGGAQSSVPSCEQEGWLAVVAPPELPEVF